jgi:hypothetical protein
VLPVSVASAPVVHVECWKKSMAAKQPGAAPSHPEINPNGSNCHSAGNARFLSLLSNGRCSWRLNRFIKTSLKRVFPLLAQAFEGAFNYAIFACHLTELGSFASEF